HLIDSPTVTLYLSLQESQPLIAQLQAGRPSRALYRKLGQYAVQIYPSHLQALLDAGAAELLDGASYRLTDPSLYNRNTGLSLEVGTGNALSIWNATKRAARGRSTCRRFSTKYIQFFLSTALPRMGQVG